MSSSPGHVGHDGTLAAAGAAAAYCSLLTCLSAQLRSTISLTGTFFHSRLLFFAQLAFPLSIASFLIHSPPLCDEKRDYNSAAYIDTRIASPSHSQGT